MVLTEPIEPPSAGGERIVVQLLRKYAGARKKIVDDTGLSRLVALGQRLSLPPAGSVALASVFQLTEAVLGRSLVTARRGASDLSGDERAILRLLGSPMPTRPGTATPDIPHGMPGALAWAVLSFRRSCGDLVSLSAPSMSQRSAVCPFVHPSLD